MKEKQMKKVADLIIYVIENGDDESVRNEVKKEVKELCDEFPIYPELNLWGEKMKLIIVMLMVVFLFLAGCTNQEEIDVFAKCLTEEGVKMYGAYWCPNCLNQKQMFSTSWKHMEYVECSLPNKGGRTQVCTDEGIDGYPTWIFPDGQRLVGVQT